MDKKGRRVGRKVLLSEKIKTQGNGYHPDLELSDRSRERLEMRTHGYSYHPDLELSERSWKRLEMRAYGHGYHPG